MYIYIYIYMYIYIYTYIYQYVIVVTIRNYSVCFTKISGRLQFRFAHPGVPGAVGSWCFRLVLHVGSVLKIGFRLG